MNYFYPFKFWKYYMMMTRTYFSHNHYLSSSRTHSYIYIHHISTSDVQISQRHSNPLDIYFYSLMGDQMGTPTMIIVPLKYVINVIWTPAFAISIPNNSTKQMFHANTILFTYGGYAFNPLIDHDILKV